MSTGKLKRLSRLLRPRQVAIIVPTDDLLITGPRNGWERPSQKLEQIVRGKPSGILGFPKALQRVAAIDPSCPTVMNLTASTTIGIHLRKALIGTVEQACAEDCVAVAVHVNFSSRFEPEMLRIVGKVSTECNRFGMPLMVIAYPRRAAQDGTDDNYLHLREGSPDDYARLVAHGVAAAAEMGADIIKTQWTGTRTSFAHVIDAAAGLPLLVAGGPMLAQWDDCVAVAREAVSAGAAGVSFGRNLFGREDTGSAINQLRRELEGVSPLYSPEKEN